MPMSERTNNTRTALARASRHHGRNSQQYADAARAFYEARITDLVEENLRKAPPLTAEQIDRLVAIFRTAPTAPAAGGDMASTAT